MHYLLNPSSEPKYKKFIFLLIFKFIQKSASQFGSFAFSFLYFSFNCCYSSFITYTTNFPFFRLFVNSLFEISRSAGGSYFFIKRNIYILTGESNSLLNNLSQSKSSNQGFAFRLANDAPSRASGYFESNCSMNFLDLRSFINDGNFSSLFIISS